MGSTKRSFLEESGVDTASQPYLKVYSKYGVDLQYTQQLDSSCTSPGLSPLDWNCQDEFYSALSETGDIKWGITPNSSENSTPFPTFTNISGTSGSEVHATQSGPGRSPACRKICLGSVSLDASSNSTSLENTTTSQELSLTTIGQSIQLWIGSSTKRKYLGILKNPMAAMFSDIINTYDLDFNFYLPKIEFSKTDTSVAFQVIADLYCFEDQRLNIGRALLRKQLYLQGSYKNKLKLKYSNPHVLEVSDSDVIHQLISEGIQVPIPHDQTGSKAEKLSILELQDRQDGISNLFTTSSNQTSNIKDFNLQVSTNITVALKQHQTIGLCWMLDKEGYHNGQNTSLRSSGGILADEMGMGKTLTTLALIATSKELVSNNGAGESMASTLIICPKSVITGWEEQIKRFTQNIRYLLYEPVERNLPKSNFHDYDVVITTYSAVAHSRSRAAKELSKSNWGRIILDEAHTIRERSTKQAKAIFALKSKYRWCLTGTPVQNKLDDYGSLLEFIRHETTGTRTTFHSNIIKPLKHRDESSLRRLQELVAETTLRRLKASSQLDLPRRKNQLHELNFSNEEGRLHILLERFVSAKIQQAIRDGVIRNTGLYAAQLILRLRQVCNHGVDLLPQSLQEELRDFHAQGGHEFAISNTFTKMICELCKSSETTDTENSATYEDCQHTICLKCNMNTTECPLCFNSSSDIISTAVEPSTKVQRLISNLQSESTSKSVVFSCWTKMLDLVGIALRRNNIGFTRLEGSLTTRERKECLRRFRNDPSCRVFLSTLGSGSTGLDLTIASEVHLLEPQFNPMLEEQALARVHRIGQTKPVTTIRYIMKNSYEEQILERQNKKLQLAELCVSGTAQTEGSISKYLECLQAVIQ